MADDTLNRIVAGAYAGCEVKKHGQHAFIKYGEERIFITKGRAKQVKVVGTGTESVGMAGVAVSSALFGVAGTADALRGINVQLLEITWNDGSVSVVKANGIIAEAITIGMYSNWSSETEKSVVADRKKVEENNNALLLVIAAVAVGLILALVLAG